MVLEVAMEPEAIAAGLVAGDDRRFLGQAEPAPSGPDLADQGVGVACRDGVKPGLLPGPDGEGQLPGGPAQLQCEVEPGAVIVLESVTWVADMGKLLVSKGCHTPIGAYGQRLTSEYCPPA